MNKEENIKRQVEIIAELSGVDKERALEIFNTMIKKNELRFELAILRKELSEEREEEKKYRVRIPDSPERTNVFALCKLVNGDVCINSTNQFNFKKHDRYILTEAEIKRNHSWAWQFKEEVE